MAGRMSRFMVIKVYHVQILLNPTLYMYLELLLQYNPPVAGGVQQHEEQS
jgi:hypothetical protein